jgi:tetratricopeptide (TPR) repeat protein
MKKSLIIAIIFQVASIGAIRADESFQALFDKANRHFEAGEFEAARDIYQSLENQGCRSDKVFYNLGNAYLKSGDLGHAILYLIRAERIASRDKDIAANLETARSLVNQKITATPANAMIRFLTGIHGMFTTGETTAAFAFLYVLSILSALSAYLSQRRRVRKRWIRMLVMAFVLFGFVTLSLAVRIYDLEFRERAVAVGAEIIARNGPGEPFTEVYKQQPGYEMVVKRHQSGWAEVVLANGYTGWVPDSSIEIL